MHEAIDRGDIMKVRFDWVKYIVQFQHHGFYAGVIVGNGHDLYASGIQSPFFCAFVLYYM